MQSQALASMTPTAQGRSRAFTLLLSGDPTWRPAVEPLLSWTTVVWKLSNGQSPGRGAQELLSLIHI
eukprot:14052646-Alexandrium_andersonii.AAC.1